jgi:hypothetical protein
MNLSPLLFAFLTLVFATAPYVRGDSVWNTRDYDLYSGDFDGDGKSDILYVAKDPNKLSGISTSPGNGPNTPLQSWSSNFLGIQWHGQQYKVIVGDFNNDRRSDVLLQHIEVGDSYLLLASRDGRLRSIAQTIREDYLGLGWSFVQHGIVSGDFSGDNYDDLFFQAAKPDAVNAVTFASFSGLFVDHPTQTFTDATWPTFKWSRQHSVISAGDFNGDGYSDLLIQPTHSWVVVGFEILIPIPVYAPNAFGIIYSQGGSTPLQQSGIKQWSRFDNGVDWAPMSATPVIGDFNNDGRDDVLLQPQQTGRQAFLLTGNASGPAFSAPSPVTSNISIAADGARLLAIRTGNSTGLYIQATSPSGTNYVATTVGANIQATVQDPSAVAIEMVSYSYDAKGRLKKVSRAGSVNHNIETSYSYDKANNRTSVTTTGAPR